MNIPWLYLPKRCFTSELLHRIGSSYSFFTTDWWEKLTPIEQDEIYGYVYPPIPDK